jgi:glycosyltransferase involved in cell wall biosynthesis
MNILHITTYLQGGAGQIIAELASWQALSGHGVTVATSRTGEQDYGNYPQWIDRLKSTGVDLLLVESTFKRDLSLNIAAFRQINESLDCASLSMIHTHAAIPSLVALLLRSRAKRPIPIVQTMHGWGIKKDSQQGITDITLMNQLDRVLTTSETSKRLLVRLGLESDLVKIVPNGIAPLPPLADENRTSILRRWKSAGFRILLCLGTVGSRKNQRLLLRAMADPRAPRDIACAIVGEGEELSALDTMAKESGIGNRVHFFGYQKGAEHFIAAADWLVLPSKNEGLPLSILEAYRAGVPVLGSDIAEIAEVILPEQTGILFQADNMDSLVQALARAATMSESKRTRMGAAAKRLWNERYTLERMLDQYDQTYQELMLK